MPPPTSPHSHTFVKMHGNGNDFVVLDLRGGSHQELSSPSTFKALADRHRGIGCDQVIVMLDAIQPDTLAHVRFFNQDGSESGACGNGARCAAWLLAADHPLPLQLRFTTPAALHQATVSSQDVISLDMGPSTQVPLMIPLAPGVDPMAVDVGVPALGLGVAVGMGNPHVVFFVEDLEAHDLSVLGPHIEVHPAFPARVNVHLVQQLAPQKIRQKTWERGAGLTLSCGSGACAVAVAGWLKKRWHEDVILEQPGGSLSCVIGSNGHVILTGPVSVVFSGVWEGFQRHPGLDPGSQDNTVIPAIEPESYCGRRSRSESGMTKAGNWDDKEGQQ